jgi:hypothetical protein
MSPSKYQGYEEHRSGDANPGRMAPLGSLSLTPLCLSAPKRGPSPVVRDATPTSSNIWFSTSFTSDSVVVVLLCQVRTTPDAAMYANL